MCHMYVTRFCNLLQYEGDVRKKILTQLGIFMCHRFPIVSIHIYMEY